VPRAPTSTPRPTGKATSKPSPLPGTSLQGTYAPKGKQSPLITTLKNVAPVPKERLMAPKAKATKTTNAKASAAAAAAAAAEKAAEDAVKEAERRLNKNKAREDGWDLIMNLKEEFGLTEQVELGLKLLEPPKLWAALGPSGNEFRRKLLTSADKDKFARSMIALQDPSAYALVRKLEMKEERERRTTKDKPAAEEAAEQPAAAEAPRPGGVIRGATPANTRALREHQHRTATRWQRARTVAPERTVVPERSRSHRAKVERRHEEQPHRVERRADGRERRTRAGRSRSRSNRIRRREDPQAPPWKREQAGAGAAAGHRERGGGAGAGAGDSSEELVQWLKGLDAAGALMRYVPALRREFTSLSEILAAYSEPAPGSHKPVLSCVEPSFFQALGVELLGHKLLLARGIASLRAKYMGQSK